MTQISDEAKRAALKISETCSGLPWVQYHPNDFTCVIQSAINAATAKDAAKLKAAAGLARAIVEHAEEACFPCEGCQVALAAWNAANK